MYITSQGKRKGEVFHLRIVDEYVRYGQSISNLVANNWMKQTVENWSLVEGTANKLANILRHLQIHWSFDKTLNVLRILTVHTHKIWAICESYKMLSIFISKKPFGAILFQFGEI